MSFKRFLAAKLRHFLKAALLKIIPKARPAFIIAHDLKRLEQLTEDIKFFMSTGDMEQALIASHQVIEVGKALRYDFYLAYEAKLEREQKKQVLT